MQYDIRTEFFDLIHEKEPLFGIFMTDIDFLTMCHYNWCARKRETFMISQQMSLLASYGAQLILVSLGLVSIFVLAFFIERILFFARNFIGNHEQFITELRAAGSPLNARSLLGEHRTEETEIILSALDDHAAVNAESFRDIATGLFEVRRQRWEKFLMFFASTGSNAPFAGLLGTVLGLMQSFSDLSLAANPDASAAMNGVSNALITTVVGIMIAIPAVVMHNHFRTRIKRAAALLQSAIDIISAQYREKEDVSESAAARNHSGTEHA